MVVSICFETNSFCFSIFSGRLWAASAQREPTDYTIAVFLRLALFIKFLCPEKILKSFGYNFIIKDAKM